MTTQQQQEETSSVGENNTMETISLTTTTPDAEESSSTHNNDKSSNAAVLLVHKSSSNNHKDDFHSLPSLMDSTDDSENEDNSKSNNSTTPEPNNENENDEHNNNDKNNSRAASQEERTNAAQQESEQPEQVLGQKRTRHEYSNDNDNNASSVHDWNVFVRKGAKLKSLVEQSLHRVAFVPPKKQKQTPNERMDMDPKQQENPEATSKIAKEKTAQVIMLQMKLKEAEAEVAVLSATNATLREAAAASSERMERTVEALRIAGTNAANARADADSSEANAAALSTQLEALKTVVDETKQASLVLHTEHQQVTEATRSLEAKVLESETENTRTRAECRRLQEERHELQQKHGALTLERDSLQTRLDQVTQEFTQLKHTWQERQAVEHARLDRTRAIEKELRETRAMLVEASAASVDTETTAALLDKTLDELRQENQQLHDTMESLQATQRQHQEAWNETLAKTESEAQQLRIKTAADQDEIQRLVLDKTSLEETMAQLKIQLAQLKRNTNTSGNNNVLLTDKSENNNNNNNKTTTLESPKHALTSTTPKKTSTLSIPMLGATGKENHCNPKLSSCCCCLCDKQAFGLMKSCQCGNKNCDKRAHSICCSRQNEGAIASVSHPGTPAPPRQPLVLCCTNMTT